MKKFKEQLPYGLVGFLIILFLDIGNIFTGIINEKSNPPAMLGRME